MRPPEGLPTSATFKGSLSSVDPLVTEKVGVLTEGLPTFRAIVGFLSRVHAVVFNEVGAAPEGLPAFSTGVRLLPAVDSLVPCAELCWKDFPHSAHAWGFSPARVTGGPTKSELPWKVLACWLRRGALSSP